MNSIQTGDVILTSDTSSMGYLVKTVLSSRWNHSGIAIRIRDGKVVKDDGDLYVYEIGLNSRKCPVFGDKVEGAGFTKVGKVLGYYDQVSVRKINRKFITDDFCTKADEFIQLTRGKKIFPKNIELIDISLDVQKKDTEKDTQFCSELMAYFYEYTLSDIYHQQTGRTYSEATLFGFLHSKNSCTPDMYCLDVSPASAVLTDEQVVVKDSEAPMASTISKPLIIILAICLVVYFSLP